MTQISVLNASADPTLLIAATTGLIVVQATTAIKVNTDFDELNDDAHGVLLAANTVYTFPGVVGEGLWATAAADSVVQVLKM